MNYSNGFSERCLLPAFEFYSCDFIITTVILSEAGKPFKKTFTLSSKLWIDATGLVICSLSRTSPYSSDTEFIASVIPSEYKSKQLPEDISTLCSAKVPSCIPNGNPESESKNRNPFESLNIGGR
jgi:hypothetical protein